MSESPGKTANGDAEKRGAVKSDARPRLFRKSKYHPEKSQIRRSARNWPISEPGWLAWDQDVAPGSLSLAPKFRTPVSAETPSQTAVGDVEKSGPGKLHSPRDYSQSAEMRISGFPVFPGKIAIWYGVATKKSASARRPGPDNFGPRFWRNFPAKQPAVSPGNATPSSRLPAINHRYNPKIQISRRPVSPGRNHESAGRSEIARFLERSPQNLGLDSQILGT